MMQVEKWVNWIILSSEMEIILLLDTNTLGFDYNDEYYDRIILFYFIFAERQFYG